jgi:hypothetical protein
VSSKPQSAATGRMLRYGIRLLVQYSATQARLGLARRATRADKSPTNIVCKAASCPAAIRPFNS